MISLFLLFSSPVVLGGPKSNDFLRVNSLQFFGGSPKSGVEKGKRGVDFLSKKKVI
jgi:hypothetical protein